MIFHSRSQPAAKKYGFWGEGGGGYKQCLSFILHFLANHVSLFIVIEISLSIQYSSETVTHLLSMMIAESSSVSLLLFLLHSCVLCYCNLHLSV